MGAALQPSVLADEGGDDTPVVETPTIPGSVREWRTATGTKIGKVGKMEGGGYWSRSTVSGDYKLHKTKADASLALTLAYMRR